METGVEAGAVLDVGTGGVAGSDQNLCRGKPRPALSSLHPCLPPPPLLNISGFVDKSSIASLTLAFLLAPALVRAQAVSSPSASPAPPVIAAGSSTVIQPDRLTALLPAPPAGWNADKPEGAMSESGGFQITTVSCVYVQGDADNAPTATLSIVDSANNKQFQDATKAMWSATSDTPQGLQQGGDRQWAAGVRALCLSGEDRGAMGGGERALFRAGGDDGTAAGRVASLAEPDSFERAFHAEVRRAQYSAARRQFWFRISIFPLFLSLCPKNARASSSATRCPISSGCGTPPRTCWRPPFCVSGRRRNSRRDRRWRMAFITTWICRTGFRRRILRKSRRR